MSFRRDSQAPIRAQPAVPATLAERVDRIEKILDTAKAQAVDTPRRAAVVYNTRPSPISPNAIDVSFSNPATGSLSLSPDAGGEEADDRPVIGLSFHGLVQLSGHPCAPALQSMTWNESEAYLERECRHSDILFSCAGPIDLSSLDLSFRACWKLQQSFLGHVLSWFPLFDHEFCAHLTKTTMGGGAPDPSDLSTSLALFVLALGALFRANDWNGGGCDPAQAQPPGLAYFQAASNILNVCSGAKYTLTAAQCYILKS